jgi:hypothetical protein
MVAKLKAINGELQRRKHHRTTAAGAWLRKIGRNPLIPRAIASGIVSL